ncbi:MAG: hypothetical protein ACYC3K_04850 [Candidatus Nanopelagicales bacterium]
MTDDGFELDPAEVEQWNSIVSSEWPAETVLVSTQVDLATAWRNAPSAGAEQHILTMYRPRRPALGALVAAIVAACGSGWVFMTLVAPAYQLAVSRGISPHERAHEIHQLTAAAMLVAVALALTAGGVAAWIVAYCLYRLRRSSCEQVTRGVSPLTRYVRPPNPATAATWILILLGVSVVAGWWIPLHLEAASGSGPAAIRELRLAAMGGLGWLAVFLVCAVGLTTWASREAGHQLRRRAAIGAPR